MSILILSNPTFQLALMTNELPCLCVCVCMCVCVCVRERERERERKERLLCVHTLQKLSLLTYLVLHCPICACFHPYDSNTTSIWIKATTLLVVVNN